MDRGFFASRLKRMENKELSEFMSLIGRDDIISFAGGIPDEKIFPVKELKQLINKLINIKGHSLFQYSSTDGKKNLKEYLVNYLKGQEITVNENQILITTGSQQGLDLLAKLFLNPGDTVAVEDPGYVGGIGAINSYEARIMGIEVDENGLRIDILEKLLKEGEKIKFLYLVPDYSNPSGMTLSLKRRYKLLKLANRYNFYIIEDTPYRELSFYNKPLPALKSIDNNEKVIYLGSFSKYFMPGFRIGWICGPEKIIELLTTAKQNTDLASNTLGQELIAYAGQEGIIQEQIKKIRPYYRQKLVKMEEGLTKYFPECCSWKRPEGGFFFWVKLPTGIKSKKLLKQAIKNRVAFVTGNSFCSDYRRGDNYIRLSFSNNTLSEIDKGLSILGKVINNF
ncbi:PLP-dependent aminotransferase family protein [Halothermothrix orenii]|uniref:Putative transcriptional regulator, GntR family n=1 Tax=Halothermothrix orenii (strain H 168 / OCM 544 / DSM 9562) TaxID=373903 RepID=B8CX26_HALOH|nr:PLP-dependent aminotransferase family protein [Halothermothrix orenii]ACL69845.1 putative transcriptional regulator, GntR family [Halothermothrix orenii H 168]